MWQRYVWSGYAPFWDLMTFLGNPDKERSHERYMFYVEFLNIWLITYLNLVIFGVVFTDLQES